MDIPGPRPALFSTAENLAQNGYLVVLPDLSYRLGSYTPQDVWAALGNNTWRPRFYDPPTNPDNFHSDISTVLAYIATLPDAKQPSVAAVGYCMGGTLSLCAAGTFPERVIAAASFHGGFLASDEPYSPHRLASQMKARLYVGAAETDTMCPPEMLQKLRETLDAAGVTHEIEVYPGTQHGWAMSDLPPYHREGAERHMVALLRFLSETIKTA
jgi:carboxymethylenebutenolidase